MCIDVLYGDVLSRRRFVCAPIDESNWDPNGR
jgi:hypothetical protein